MEALAGGAANGGPVKPQGYAGERRTHRCLPRAHLALPPSIRSEAAVTAGGFSRPRDDSKLVQN